MDIIAHRGNSYLKPENTLDSFKQAIKDNSDYIEFDIQRTLDGVFVVCHDPYIDRVSDGKGYISSMTYSDLCKFNFSMSKKKKEKILTLKEALDLISSHSKIFLETKSTTLGYEKEILSILSPFPKNKIIIHSFHKKSLRNLHRLGCKFKLAFLIGIELFDRLLIPYYLHFMKRNNISYAGLNQISSRLFHFKHFCSVFRKNNIGVYAWTDVTYDQIIQALNYGCFAVVVNDPKETKSLLRNI